MAQKTLRFISLLIRAIPMLLLLVGWPVVAVLVILLPAVSSSSSADVYTIATGVIGAHLIVILILQV